MSTLGQVMQKPPRIQKKLRGDIQGLRAILMVQVLLFHAWFIGSPIGVDAFIMISAYLMTASFIRRAESGSTPSVLDRWATTFKRLLPPLALVVVLTLFGSLLWLPQTRWSSMIDQAYASLTYWQNWLLASIATDYFAQDHALSSPLQHLWSMSMQGQVFLLWPVLMAVLVIVAKKMKWSIRATIFIGFTAITALSLGWLVAREEMTTAIYFDTRARIWEFALGSALAAVAPRLSLPGWARQLVSTIALATLLVFSLVSIGTYPGPMAAVPLLATSALLMFPTPEGSAGISRLLAWRPLVVLGNMSYAVYLIHWPIFVFYLVVTGQERLGVESGIILIEVSVALAYLLTKYVDDPIRRLPWANTTQRKAQIIAFTLWLAMTFVFTTQIGVAQTAQAAQRQFEEAAKAAPAVEPTPPDLTPRHRAPLPALTGFPGAAAMVYEGGFAFDSPPIPGPLTLDHEWVTYPGSCGPRARELFFIYPQTGCTSVGDPETAKGRVLVAGSSHAEQVLMPAVRLFAEARDLYVESVLMAGCPWSMPNPGESANCGAHNENILRYAQEESFDYVFLIVTATKADNPGETLGYGVETLISELTETGATVIGVRDNLRSLSNLYECANAQSSDEGFGGCLLERSEFFASDSLLDPLLDLPGFEYVNIMDLYCTDTVCPTIAGNVHVYLDANHVTQSYADTMAPIMVERFAKAAGR